MMETVHLLTQESVVGKRNAGILWKRIFTCNCQSMPRSFSHNFAKQQCSASALGKCDESLKTRDKVKYLECQHRVES